MKQYEIYCYLCEGLICRADKPVKIICELCIEVLEKEDSKRTKEYNRVLDKLKQSDHFKHSSE